MNEHDLERSRSSSATPSTSYRDAPRTSRFAEWDARAAASAEASPDANPNFVKVLAPLTGVFYRAASPDAAPFVEPGDRIEAGDVVCVLEAMKLFNEIQSDYARHHRAHLPENGELVSQGDELLWIDPSFVTADRRQGLSRTPRLRRTARRSPRTAGRAAVPRTSRGDRRRRRSGAARRQKSVVVRERRQRRPRRSTWRPNSRGDILRERPGAQQRSAVGELVDVDVHRQRLRLRHVFSRQVEAFAQKGDVVIGMTTSGTSRNVVLALEAAQKARCRHGRIYR